MPIFCKYDNNVLVKPVYVKVLKKEKHVKGYNTLSLLIEAYFSFLLLWQMRSYELIQSKTLSKKEG